MALRSRVSRGRNGRGGCRVVARSRGGRACAASSPPYVLRGRAREAHGSCGGKAAHPQKPGRPSHNYHTAFMGMLGIVVTVDVQPGRMHSGKVGAKGVFAMLDALPRELWPRLEATRKAEEERPRARAVGVRVRGVREGAAHLGLLRARHERRVDFPPLRKSPNFGIMDALGRFEVRERSAAGVQTMWFEPWRPR